MKADKENFERKKLLFYFISHQNLFSFQTYSKTWYLVHLGFKFSAGHLKVGSKNQKLRFMKE